VVPIRLDLTAMRNVVVHLIDHLVVPGLLVCGGIATHLLVVAGLAPWLISALVVGAVAVVAAVVERARPERAEHRPLDQPLWIEAAHFLFNYHLGYALAFGVCALIALGVAAGGLASPWPARWPLALQVLLAVTLAEGCSYWQHRLFHRVRWLWPFHALHHSGSRLNVVRTGRFHFVDIGPGALLLFLPLVLLQAPAVVVTWTATLAGILGVLQHANMRVRTPRWLDGLMCTPAVHRFHHSARERESNANFGTTVMLFDRLFGSYRPPHAPGPDAVGIVDDATPAGFLPQTIAPFRRARRDAGSRSQAMPARSARGS